MTYFIRSVKYFFYFALIFCLIIAVLLLTGLAEGDIDSMFRGGWNAIWKIAIMFAVVAAVYPKVGFIKRAINATGGIKANRTEIVDYLRDRSFDVEKEGEGFITFRHRGFVNRLSRMLEDRITITEVDEGLEIEGLRKDAFRLASGLEYKLSDNLEND